MASTHQRLISWLRRATRLCWAPGYIFLFAAVLVFQLFVPPSVGLADNNDSVRIIHGEGLTANYPLQERYFRYFTPDYLKANVPPAAIDAPLWTGRISFLIALRLGSLKSSDRFDVRWLGFVHLCFYLLCFGLFLAVVKTRSTLVKWVMPAVAIWIFGDVFYAAYLNSLYLDAMGLLCFLLFVIALWVSCGRASPRWALLLLPLAGLGLAASKPLNAPTVLLAGAVTALDASLLQERRVARAIVSAFLILTGGFFVMRTPASYEYPTLVDVVMIRIAKGANAAKNISGFGLIPEDLRFAGEDAFRPDGPGADPGFRTRFAHTTAGTLVMWYFKHPASAIAFLRDDFLRYGSRLRPLGEIEKIYSPTPSDSKSRLFCSWSNLHSHILSTWPFVIVLLYTFAIASGALVFLERSYLRFSVFVTFLAVVGILQFCAASLLDAIETARHLFMFHVTTDALVLTIVAGLLHLVSRQKTSRAETASLRPGIAYLRGAGAAATPRPTSPQTGVGYS